MSHSINNFNDYDISQTHDWECLSLYVMFSWKYISHSELTLIFSWAINPIRPGGGGGRREYKRNFVTFTKSYWITRFRKNNCQGTDELFNFLGVGSGIMILVFNLSHFAVHNFQLRASLGLSLAQLVSVSAYWNPCFTRLKRSVTSHLHWVDVYLRTKDPLDKKTL